MTLRGRGRVVARGGIVAVVLLLLAMWGCEGGHLFAPISIGPRITDLTAPEAVDSGDSITVSVRALGQVRVDSIVTTVRVGTHTESKVAPQGGILSDFSTTLGFLIPPSVSDTLGTVEAYAVDGRGNVGPTSAVTMRAIDTALPTVSLSLGSPQIGLGAELQLQVTAGDNVGLSQIGFRIVDLTGNTLDEFLIEETGTQVDRVLDYFVAEELGRGDVLLIGVAIDHEGNVGESLPIPATLTDIDLPEVEILMPLAAAQAPAENPLLVQVQLRDNDAIQLVRIDGVAYRGDPTFGTEQVVTRFVAETISFAETVTDTILQRNLIPAADSTSENAFIRVEAFDREGNVARDSVEISLLIDELDPVVRIDRPVDGAERAVGDSILVETFIQKLPAPFRTGIRTLRLEGISFRGDPEIGTDQIVPRFLTRTVTLDPPVFDGVVISRYLIPTMDNTQEPVFIIATAIDEWGNEGADTVQVQLVPDTLAPTVQILAPPNGASRTAGDSILVQATGAEPPNQPNQRGVAAMIVDGVAYRPAQIPKYQQERVDFSPPQQNAFMSVWIKPTADLTAEGVWIRVTAEDGAGNTATDSIMITLTPPPPAPPPPPQLGLVPIGFGLGGAPPPHPRPAPVPRRTHRAWVGSGGIRGSVAFSRRRRASGSGVCTRWRDGPPQRPPPKDSHPAPAGFFHFVRGASR